MRNTLIFASFLCVLISTSVFAVNGDMGSSTEPLTDGSETYPYLIEDINDFDTFADPANAATYWAAGVHTKLMTNIDLSGRTHTTAVIAPDTETIGPPLFDGFPYSGIFDGNDLIVKNLTINVIGVDYNDYLGLFGKIEGLGAEVNNLGVVEINISGWENSDYLGGLCGANENGSISDCYATGSVTSSYDPDFIGGLCGHNLGGSISNSYSSGVVRTNSLASQGTSFGGLCGSNEGGSISNCYSTSVVTGGAGSILLGGLCGANETGNISHCYATGAVTGGNGTWSIGFTGGLCGVNGNGSISNCYSTGVVTSGTGSPKVGGLIGFDDTGLYTSNYWNSDLNSGVDGIGNLSDPML